MGISFSEVSENQYEISCKISYLVGVNQSCISKDPNRVKMFKALGENKNARIIRNLCIVRTAMLANFGRISTKIAEEGSNVYFLNEYIPKDALEQLSKDGVECIKKGNKSVAKHIIEINRIISDRINNCKNLFPIWLNWDYVRDLFVMKNGFTVEGVNAEKQTFYDNREKYPFQMYINWVYDGKGGHILHNDRVIVCVMYEQHGETFGDRSRVCDVGEEIKERVYDFIAASGKTIIAVDCENSDPYKMCATLKNLSENYTSKISKIILIDDINASSAWKILEYYTSIPVEYKLIERVKKGKSLVDITLSSVICREHYTGGVDSVILFSSDSDYWGLASVMPEMKFHVMVERGSFSEEYRVAIEEAGMSYCYIDDFFTGNALEIKYKAILKELGIGLKSVKVNVNNLLDGALSSTRAELSPAERKQFYDKYLKRLTVEVDDDGNVVFNLGTNG